MILNHTLGGASNIGLIVRGRRGNDEITVDASVFSATALSGNEGDDSIVGGSGPDRIRGGSGADDLTGGSGADLITGADESGTATRDGDDRFNGGEGDDTLIGGAGRDSLDGGSGSDRCLPRAGLDQVANCESPTPVARLGAGQRSDQARSHRFSDDIATRIAVSAPSHDAIDQLLIAGVLGLELRIG